LDLSEAKTKTGPKTAEGKARISAAASASAKRRWAQVMDPLSQFFGMLASKASPGGSLPMPPPVNAMPMQAEPVKPPPPPPGPQPWQQPFEIAMRNAQNARNAPPAPPLPPWYVSHLDLLP